MDQRLSLPITNNNQCLSCCWKNIGCQERSVASGSEYYEVSYNHMHGYPLPKQYSKPVC